MDIQLYIICFVVGLLGMALQTVLKLRSLQGKAKSANVEFKAGQYFKEDKLSIAASVITLLIALFVIDEIVGENEKIMEYLKIGFAFIGYTGSDIASRVFGVISQKINKTIDYKTDVADGKIKPEQN
jgi:hypothetical protein